MRIMRNNAAKVSRSKKERKKKIERILFSGQSVKNTKNFQVFFPGLAQRAGRDGMRKVLRRKVNGPVNNGASAPLHSVSI